MEINIDVGVVDSSGLSALTLMVDKMPPVAKKALDCFHKTDRPNRKQYFYLNLLEPTQPGNNSVLAKTPMQVCFIDLLIMSIKDIKACFFLIFWREFQ